MKQLLQERRERANLHQVTGQSSNLEPTAFPEKCPIRPCWNRLAVMRPLRRRHTVITGTVYNPWVFARKDSDAHAITEKRQRCWNPVDAPRPGGQRSLCAAIMVPGLGAPRCDQWRYVPDEALYQCPGGVCARRTMEGQVDRTGLAADCSSVTPRRSGTEGQPIQVTSSTAAANVAPS